MCDPVAQSGPSVLELAKSIAELVQALVISCATVFTAWWTYRTFAQKERIQELKELRRTVDEYFNAMKIFCASLKPAEVAQQEIQEKLALIALHNRLFGLSRLNLYTKKDVRERVQKLVGGWIGKNRIETMVHREGSSGDEKARKKAWRKFEEEHKEVSDLIEREAGRVL